MSIMYHTIGNQLVVKAENVRDLLAFLRVEADNPENDLVTQADVDLCLDCVTARRTKLWSAIAGSLIDYDPDHMPCARRIECGLEEE